MDNNVKSTELQELKQKLSESGFSEGVINKLDALLEKSIASGSMSEVDKTQLKGLMNIDVEAMKIKAKSMEDVAALIVGELSEVKADSEAGDDENVYTEDYKGVTSAPVEPATPVSTEPVVPVSNPVTPISTPAAPVTEEPAPVVYPWSQPAEPVKSAEPMAPVAPTVPTAPVAAEPAPTVSPWNQTVAETPVTETPAATQPAPFPGSTTGQV